MKILLSHFSIIQVAGKAMNNNIQHRKVRYVKCPKCARILPEPEQVPLYTCGGCNTILQSKKFTGKKIEAQEDERDKGEECENTALEQQKEVGLEPVNVDEGSRVSGNEINSLAEDVPVAVTKLGKEEKSVTEQKSSIERIHEKLASVTSSDEAPMSTEVQNENRDALPEVESGLGVASERIASDVPQRPDGEINSTDNVEVISRQNIENLENSDFSDSEQKRPINNTVTSEPVRQSPAKRSPAYDGSVSSCDGNDDKVGRQSERLDEGTEKNSERAGVSSGRTNYGNLRSQARVKSSSYQLSDGVFPRRIPLHRISSEMAFETGSTSSYRHDESPIHWTRREPDSQMRYLEGRRFSEVSWKENEFFPMYYNGEIPGDYHRRRSESLFLSGNLPRTQYSGDVYNRKYQIQDPYIHPHPDARRWSTQLPSGPPRYNHLRGPMTYMEPPREVKWDPYDPYPINPYGWAHDTIYHSDDQRHRERKKSQAVKRCLRPMAGGAPFITCHFCFTVLQLPEEFLLPKGKKIHKVKCGTCSKILEFSLENDSCLAPHLPEVKSDSPSRASHSESRTEERQAQVTWELPARSKSPLHRLMGYSSPRDLFIDDKE